MTRDSLLRTGSHLVQNKDKVFGNIYFCRSRTTRALDSWIGIIFGYSKHTSTLQVQPPRLPLSSFSTVALRIHNEKNTEISILFKRWPLTISASSIDFDIRIILWFNSKTHRITFREHSGRDVYCRPTSHSTSRFGISRITPGGIFASSDLRCGCEFAKF